MLKSLRSQLSLSILTLLLTMIVLMSVFANRFISREFQSYVERQEAARSEAIVSDLATQYNGLTRTWDAGFLHTIGMYSLYGGYILKVYGADGALLWDAENHDMTLCNQIMGEITARMDNAKKSGGFLTHTYDVTRGQTRVGSVAISYYTPFFYTENDSQFLAALNTVFLVIGLAAGALAIALGGLLARRIAWPTVRTAEVARRIARGEYDIRLAEHTGTRELDDLVASINQLAAALREQENLRKRLTSDVAHELRTPLTAVTLHLEAMIEGLWEPTPERLTGCYEELIRLSALVKDLQRLARVEGENLQLRRAPTDLRALADTVVGSLSAQAQAREQSLTAEGLPVLVSADRERLQQVLINLVSNAVQYTPPGGRISVETEDQPLSGILRVRDNGVGIAPEDQPLVFERFYRTDQSRTRSTGGAGIGLAIAKAIVTAHGGTITLESRLGEGSCFTVTLPKAERLSAGADARLTP